ncbi:hypothetical protein [Palaeococcus ferrophilus]|uniref:hypothetical protein n=1 Tax=Palaeococcus ferrophilus TaxID=83868 RepID=UPI00064F2042|nr:hypothetical protein [Palaeococcus ferrophilus]
MEDILNIPQEDVIISVIYDKFSVAWAVGFALLVRGLNEGAFGVISNYNIPVQKLVKKFEFLGYNLKEAIREDNVAVIDLFGSKYGRDCSLKNVFLLDSVDPATINPKISRIYEKLKPNLEGRQIIRLVYTLDGAALMLGEEPTLRLLNQTIALRRIDAPDSTLILLVNKDVVSEKTVAWVAGISDYVFLGTSALREKGIEERLHLMMSPEEGFEPTTFKLTVSKGRKVERLRARRLSP